MKGRLLVSAVLAAWCVTASAYEFGDIAIAIPQGFEGPQSREMGRGNAQSVAYKYPHDDGSGTLLQMTRWEPGEPMPEMARAERKRFNKQYLLQFLSGVERRREDFERGDVTFVEIDGQPVARVRWSGLLQGRQLEGVMYCVIHADAIYSFHTQDRASLEGRYIDRAINAFETIDLQ